MRSPKRPKLFAPACALLLALAACSSRDDAAEGAAQPDSAAARTAAAAPGGDCTPPPAAPFDTTDGQPWSAVQPYLESLSWTAARAPVKVKLCQGKDCNFTGTIQSETRTYCFNGAEAASDTALRMLGKVTAAPNSPQVPSMGFTDLNRDGIVYLLARQGRAYALYRDPSNTTRYVPVGTETGWVFNFCDDRMPSRHARAAFKNYRTGKPVGGISESRDAQDGGTPVEEDTLDDGDPDDTALVTGWMSCISGCCRFYGSPPPPPGETDTLRGDAAVTIAGPPVCPDTVMQ